MLARDERIVLVLPDAQVVVGCFRRCGLVILKLPAGDRFDQHVGTVVR